MYICPQGEQLSYRSQSQHHGRQVKIYRSDACPQCPLRDQCTSNKQKRRTISRGVNEHLLELADHKFTQSKALRLIRHSCSEHPFIPIAGLHHARRNSASGFCVFNDCGVAIEVLRQRYGVHKVAYVDIDAHHGDGVFYSFEQDPNLCFVDFHEDGQYLYPGTGSSSETGKGEAVGTKLNIPLPPGATDEQFLSLWPKAEAFLQQAQPEFILLQCGADSVAGDPITHLQFSEQSHAHTAKRLREIADVFASSRLIAMGGGGYNRSNLASAWCAVVQQLLAKNT